MKSIYIKQGMSSLVVTGLITGGSIIGTLLTRDITVRAISNTNSSIINMLSENLWGENLLKSTVDKLDILYKLEVIESYLLELPDEINENKTIQKALDGIHDMCQKIHVELTNIKQKISDHYLKYFYYFRTLDLTYDMALLENHVYNLDHRFKLFLSICQNKKLNC